MGFKLLLQKVRDVMLKMRHVVQQPKTQWRVYLLFWKLKNIRDCNRQLFYGAHIIYFLIIKKWECNENVIFRIIW